MKADPVLLSVIIPAYNAADTIAACVTSAQGQYDFSHEIIVADDGSEDGTVRVVGELHFSNVRVLQCPHGGVSAARNAGLDAARGKWIFFADADDRIAMDEIARMLGDASEQDDLVMFSYAEVSSDGTEKVFEPPLREGRYTEREDFEALADHLLDSPFAMRSVTHFMKGRVYQYLFSARFLKESGLRFKEGLHFSEDCLFIYRCFLAAKSMSVRKNVGYRRLYEADSASRSYRPNHWEEYKMLLAGLTEALGRKPERADQLLYANGNYVMGRAVRHFGSEDKAAGLAVVRRVLDDPAFSGALAGLHFSDWTFKERIRNQLAKKRLYRLYRRWLWMQKGK